MAITSEMAINQVARTAQLIDSAVDAESLAYNFASDRVTILELAVASSYNYEDFKAHVDSLNNWMRQILNIIQPSSGELQDHESEAERIISDGRVILTGVIGLVTFQVIYDYSTDIVTIQPRAALDMSWITFQEYVKMLRRVLTGINLLKVVKKPPPEV